jgi:hypothetical protein
MNQLNLNKLALPHTKSNGEPQQQQESQPPSKIRRFLKGPIDWEWITKAGCLSGQALHVAVVLWFWAGIKKSRTVLLSNKTLKELGVSRYAKKRALIALEGVGLITVNNQKGRAPVVTIIDLE